MILRLLNNFKFDCKVSWLKRGFLYCKIGEVILLGYIKDGAKSQSSALNPDAFS